MARILLVYPPFKAHQITPPLGIAYLAAYLEQEGHDVSVIDANLKEYDVSAVASTAKQLEPDVVGITTISHFFDEACSTVKAVKKVTEALVVLGGPHASCLPEESLRESGADLVVVGEGEATLAEIVECVRKDTSDFSKIKGVAYLEKGNFCQTDSRPLIKDLDTLPFPAWKLIRPESYPPAPHGALYKRFPIAPIVTSRGCPYRCSFCASPTIWQRKIRFRSPESILDEIEMLVRERGIREIHFEDDNLTFKKEHVRAICQGIIDRKLDIVWACPNGVRIDTLDRKLVKLMKRSGCYLLAFGIESASQAILDGNCKNLKLEMVPQVVKMVREEGILTWGFFIIGLPGETEATARETISFSLKTPFDRAQFSIFSPLPGTAPFEELRKRKPNIQWHELSYSDGSIYRTEQLTSENIASLQKEAFRRFYLRPRIFFKMAFGIRPRQIPWIVKRMKQYHFFKR